MEYIMGEKDRMEILQVIAFYEKHGYCWLDIVAFLAAKAAGYWTRPTTTDEE